MRTTKSWIAARASVLLISLGLFLAASGGASAEASKKVNFADNPDPVTISTAGGSVTLQPIFEDADEFEVLAAVQIIGFPQIVIKETSGSSQYFDRWAGIGLLSKADAAPSVLLQGYTGGAHCCATLQVVTPFAGRLKTLEFDPVDGGSDDTFPNDLDGDGTVDFVRQDDNFRYQFASGAGSYSPPKIYNIYKGQIVDVSGDPAFRPRWEKFAADTWRGCSDRSNEDRNGACAAFVAASARLGRFELGLKEAEAVAAKGDAMELPEDCKAALVNHVCPAGSEVKFYTFGAAIRWFLQKQGYIGN